MKRILKLKEIRLIWLDKQIVKLRKRIERYKLTHLILILLLISLSSCTIPLRIIQEQKIVNREPLFFSTDHPIIKAFAKNGLPRENITPYLSDYGKEDFDGFWEYMKGKFPKEISADWHIKELYTRLKIDYNYFVEKGKHER